MFKKLKPFFTVKSLKEKELNIFTPLEFKRLFGVSDYAVKWFIGAHTKDGVFIKLRRGLYTIADSPANNYLIANRLYEPSYISFDTALSFHGIIPETIYAMVSATSKISREFEVEKINFTYHKIKKEAYIGYEPINYLGQTVLVAEPEKALADYLYFVALNKRGLHYERMDLGKIKKAKLLEYVKLFNNKKAVKLVNKVYAEFRNHKKIY